MIQIENVRVFNFEGAMRGLRNPLDSWGKSDSLFGIRDTSNDDGAELEFVLRSYGEQEDNSRVDWLKNNGCSKYFDHCELYEEYAYIGKNDLNLAQRMIGAGTDESKFLRQIMITMDITAPFYWWKEFDTYKIGTVANSCSTMHKITAYPITMDNFSFDLTCDAETKLYFTEVVKNCESLRKKYLETKDKRYWRELIQLLPESWNQKRTVTLNYQVARTMYFARRNHKLIEWHKLCDLFMELPYGKDFIGYEKSVQHLNEFSKEILNKLDIKYEGRTEEEILQEVSTLSYLLHMLSLYGGKNE